jgi:glycosyltransferase involved in cell wall biosynthesis
MLMRIFMVVALPPPVNGQSFVSQKIAAELSRRSEVDLVVINNSPGAMERSAQYHFNRIIGVMFGLWKMFSVTLLDRRKTPSTCYLVYEAGLGFVYTAVLCLAARLLCTQTVLHHHSSQHTLRYSRRFGLLSKLIAKRSVHICLSERMRLDLERLYCVKGEVIVSSNACHVESFACDRTRFSPGDGRLSLGILSNLTVEKGAVAAGDAFEALLRNGIDCTFLIAGPLGDSESAKAVDRLLNLYPERCQYLGPVYGPNKADFLQRLDVFLFPSRYVYEAQPLVVLEALSMGLPVVSTDAGYISETIPSVEWTSPLALDFNIKILALLVPWAHSSRLLDEASVRARDSFQKQKQESLERFGALIERLSTLRPSGLH